MHPTPASRTARLLALTAAWFALVPAGARAIEVTVGFVGDPQSTAYLGASQGLDEANIQGRFLGQTYQLVTTTADALAAGTAPAVDALVVAADAATLTAVGASAPDVPVFNVLAEDDALRERCSPNLLHVIPSSRMKQDAEAQWAQAKPDSPAKAVAWNPGFTKYAASQLNKRYEAKAARPMDDAAWAGWAAVKLLADSVARLQSTDHAALLAFVKDEMNFDGQKGVDMNFRPNGQLRQVLLLEHDGKVVGEAPVRGVVDIEDLDSLGQVDCAP